MDGDRLREEHERALEAKRQELRAGFEAELEAVANEVEKTMREEKRKKESELRSSQDRLRAMQDLERGMGDVYEDKKREVSKTSLP